MPRLWLTRTQPFADESAARLRSMGYEVSVAPLITTVELPLPSRLPPRGALLIFTSRKAVAVFAKLISDRHWSCLCVGDATAEAAQAVGFKHVQSAQGDADNVTLWIKETVNLEQPIYHASSAHPRGEIIERLQEAGFQNASREIFYRAESVTDDPRIEPLDDDIILLYSPMAAASLVSLNLNLQGMEIISISPAVDAALGAVDCKARYVADNPTQDSLFTHLP